ncbi:MAG TPA: BON domain-containing protein [Pirellulaceae bacterium]|jgi:hyperosmotically inducible periplasmic protein|nr:BON domain-containing protein [Pirellulaceae bacterium]
MQQIPDRTIDQQVAQKLSNRGINSPSQVTVQTRRGEVTLSGLVQYPHQKNSAVQVANSVMGVRRVIDNLTVKPVVRY